MKQLTALAIEGILVTMMLIGAGPVLGAGPDEATDEILRKIMVRKEEHARRSKETRPVEYAAFFDFDGTIIDGDITEGKGPSRWKAGYKGLAELAIVKGLAKTFAGRKGFREYYAEYREREAKDHKTAYAWAAERFANLPPEKASALRDLVDEHFRKVLRKKLFASSVRIIRALQRAGIKVYIVSASATVFVHGARVYFRDIPIERMTGIGRERNHKGRLIDPIVNYADGKTLRIRRIAARRDEKVVILAGFGNSWGTDGHFLDYIAKVEKGVAVMINGGKAPKADHGLIEIEQRKTLEDVGEDF